MVSRNSADRLKPIASGGSVHVAVPILKMEVGNGRYHATCSCQWVGNGARRLKVAQDKAQRHLDKHHGGNGIWL
jgi:hypothetical protein